MEEPQLPESMRLLIKSRENTIYLSAISVYEIAAKVNKGGLALDGPVESFIPEQREKQEILALPFTEGAAALVSKLPLIHKDPFDRMLIAQSIAEDLVLVTPDRTIRQYPVKWLW